MLFRKQAKLFPSRMSMGLVGPDPLDIRRWDRRAKGRVCRADGSASGDGNGEGAGITFDDETCYGNGGDWRGNCGDSPSSYDFGGLGDANGCGSGDGVGDGCGDEDGEGDSQDDRRFALETTEELRRAKEGEHHGKDVQRARSGYCDRSELDLFIGQAQAEGRVSGRSRDEEHDHCCR